MFSLNVSRPCCIVLFFGHFAQRLRKEGERGGEIYKDMRREREREREGEKEENIRREKER